MKREIGRAYFSPDPPKPPKAPPPPPKVEGMDPEALKRLAQMRRSLEGQRTGRSQLVISPQTSVSGLRIIE
jgi:hypothetical protein